MDRLRRVAPIFPVRDLDVALAHYERLGFATRRYEDGGYGYAAADGVEIHLGVVANPDDHGRASAYLFVDDADGIGARWEAAGVEVHPPEDTEWGQREGAVVDPDGNVIRFGSPIVDRGASTAEAIEVVRAAFAALERGDTATAFGSFADAMRYQLHGAHPLAGTFTGKPNALRALADLSRAGGPGSTLRLAGAWSAGPQLVVAHLVRRTDSDEGPGAGDVATIIRVEDGEITEIVSVTDRALEAFWAASNGDAGAPSG
jgi:ketosteroid isomerase-like protein